MTISHRFGIGFDLHPLTRGRALVLGGVEIPFDVGLAGHSDGDVLIHALIDALLGAAVLGDIGAHFPSSDSKYEGVASTFLLREAVRLLEEAGWQPVHVDATILAERPVLRPYVERMRQTVGENLGIAPSSVSLKATTTDGLGVIGRAEGIGAMAAATLESVE